MDTPPLQPIMPPQPSSFHGPPHNRRNVKRPQSVNALQTDKLSLSDAAKVVCLSYVLVASVFDFLRFILNLGDGIVTYKDTSLCIARATQS